MTFALSNLWEVNLFLYSVSSNVLCVKHTQIPEVIKSVKYLTLIRGIREIPKWWHSFRSLDQYSDGIWFHYVNPDNTSTVTRAPPVRA